MRESAFTPTLASVIVLRIQEFTRKPVAEQTSLKAQLEALVALAIDPLPVADRIVLDAPDGAAVLVLGSPRVALDVALRSEAAAADLPVCIGVNHGPVRPASDLHRGPGFVGDALATGMALANVATPGRLVASRSFHEALEASAPGSAADLTSAGTFTDPSVRTHQLFTRDPRTALARRRRLITTGTVAVILILGLGIAARMVLQGSKPVPPAVIQFEIKPQGDVYIDGVLKGRTPPLTRIEVSPGPHAIEVRNDPFPPLRVDVNPGSTEELTISHTFSSPKSSPRSSPKGSSKGQGSGNFFRDLRREFGR